MRMYDIIKKKRDGKALSKEEINFVIDGYIRNEIKDYQVAALLMAIYYNSMNIDEIVDLTFAIRDSGVKLDFSKIKGIRVDKHSTGGVGDKTSLVVAPIVASLGVKVAKMSGRGLGHTGGTIDKLESIPGFRVDISQDEFLNIVNNVGIAIVGQNSELAPADKKLYALRDVTATVDSIPLIVSSIMGKKLAADDDCIVLDVKCGSGAFAKNIDDAKELASIMVEIGKRAGKKMLAVISNMDIPLGNAIGNSLEVIEAIETLKGRGPKDFYDICIHLAASMLYLAQKGSFLECKKMAQDSIENKSALNTLKKMIKAQGGDDKCIDDYSIFKRAKYEKDIISQYSGYIESVDTEGYGIASLMLGAGRNTKEDEIDYSAGIVLIKKVGDYVIKGDVIAKMYTSCEKLIDGAEDKFISSTKISSTKPKDIKLILDEIR